MRAPRALPLPEVPLELMLSAEGAALSRHDLVVPRGGFAGATAVRSRSMSACPPVLSLRYV
jgi:hypothetical protein